MLEALSLDRAPGKPPIASPGKHQLNAAILLAAFRRLVGRYRRVFSEATRDDCARGDSLL
jgi:hypothetical protein